MPKDRRLELFTLCINIVILGFVLGVLPNIYSNHKSSLEKQKIDEYLEELSVDVPVENDDYLFILEIPKLSLQKGIYLDTSTNNSINKNIIITSESDMPNTDNGNVILKSNTNNINSDNLEKEDEVYIYHNKIKYTYKIHDIYNEQESNIKIDKSRNTLTLITKNSTNNETESVIILYLNKKEEY
jgi:LPXTG-site transpeptidase (sortase) family protein